MLAVLLWVSAGLWALALIQFGLNHWLVSVLERSGAPEPTRWPSVSIVVPARNEETAVGRAVQSFCEQDYPDFEVIVVDDGSTDATPEILSELESRFENLRVIRGEEPPPGWLGKTNALETGRKSARGEWLVFSDADILYSPSVLRLAVPLALREKAGLVFLMPQFILKGVVESAILCTLPLFFAVLPTWLVSRTRSPLFAAGGGVFNMVKREALEDCGAFESLKDAVVDDIGLGVQVKAAGHKVLPALAQDSIRIRMYAGARAAFGGFTKNAYPAIKRLSWLWPLPTALGALTSVLPHVGLAVLLARGESPVPALAALAMMHVVFGAMVIRFRLPWYVVLLNPIRELCWWLILLRSWLAYRRAGGVSWRGRSYGP